MPTAEQKPSVMSLDQAEGPGSAIVGRMDHLLDLRRERPHQALDELG